MLVFFRNIKSINIFKRSSENDAFERKYLNKDKSKVYEPAYHSNEKFVLKRKRGVVIFTFFQLFKG